MPKQTLQDRFCAALETRGESLQKLTHKYKVYSRTAGGYYYVGRSGGLRIGCTIADSVPVSDTFKQKLLNEGK